MNTFSRITATAAVALIAASVAVGAKALDVKDSFRTPKTSYLITATGEVFTTSPGQRLQKLFLLSDKRRHPYRWAHAPMSFVHWKSRWLVADGSAHLTQFDESGTFETLIDVPVRVPMLAATDDAVWAVNMMASNGAELWRSTDGRTYSRYVTGIAARLDLPVSRLVVVRGSSTGDVYVASIVGAPVIHRVWPLNRRADLAIAYSRSKARFKMEEAVGFVGDVAAYSLPLRDVLPLSDGGFVILRNREDVRGAGRTLDLLKGRRADRYDRAGHQVATAVFPRSVHWLTEVTDGAVTGVSNTGDIVAATWGKALKGEIISP